MLITLLSIYAYIMHRIYQQCQQMPANKINHECNNLLADIITGSYFTNCQCILHNQNY